MVTELILLNAFLAISTGIYNRCFGGERTIDAVTEEVQQGLRGCSTMHSSVAPPSKTYESWDMTAQYVEEKGSVIASDRGG